MRFNDLLRYVAQLRTDVAWLCDTLLSEEVVQDPSLQEVLREIRDEYAAGQDQETGTVGSPRTGSRPETDPVV